MERFKEIFEPKIEHDFSESDILNNLHAFHNKRTRCENCENVFIIFWVEESKKWNDFGKRYCPFCGDLTQEW